MKPSWILAFFVAENHKEVGDMKMEAEVGPMHLPAKGHRGAHMASGSGGETSYTFPFGLPEGTSLQTSWFWVSGLLSYERVDFRCSQPSNLWQFVSAAPANTQCPSRKFRWFVFRF